MDIQCKLVEYGLLPPRNVRDGLSFWEGDGNVVFPKLNCPGDHAEG